MKRIVISMAAGSVLAAFALAQPARRADSAMDPGGVRRGTPYSAPLTRQDAAASNRSLLVYALTNSPQTGVAAFGAADLGSGAYVQIGSGLPQDLGHALVPVPGMSFLSLGLSGVLYAIDPRTGVATVVGATGLDDCSTPASPCGPNSAVTIGSLGGKYYALDFSQNLYSLDPATGATKLIGPSGIPAITTVPGTIDPASGKLNLYFETLFSFGGKLYANFDTSQLDFSTGLFTPVIPAALYELNVETGQATTIAPTDLGLLTIVNVNGTVYAFNAAHLQFVTLDPSTGQTQPVSNLDPSAGLVCGATPARPSPSN